MAKRPVFVPITDRGVRYSTTRRRVRAIDSVSDWRRGPVLLVGDVGAPRCARAFVVDVEQREMGHEARGRSAVPVILAGLEEDPIARADDLDGAAAPLCQTDALGDVDGLAVRVAVPGRPRARREVDAARAQSRAV